jgi:hypothetical protein
MTSPVFALPEMVLVVPRGVYSSFKLGVARPWNYLLSVVDHRQDLFEPLLVGRDTQ